MSNELVVFNLGGGVMSPEDAELARSLSQEATAGLGGSFKRTARLSMSNSGDFELIDSEGEIIQFDDRKVNIVIVDQRPYVSRMHYDKSYDEMKASGEFEAPTCTSYDGITPDESSTNKQAEKCKECPYSVKGSKGCTYYRRIVAVLANEEDGTFSEPFIIEPKAQSLFDKDVSNKVYVSLQNYLTALANTERNGVKIPTPPQWVVTSIIPKPRAETATMKFSIATLPNGGFWVLNEAQRKEILALKETDEVQDMLKPFDAATQNPSSLGRIPVLNVEVPDEQEEDKQAVEETKTPAKKAPPKKSPPKKEEVKPKTKMVVLGLDHPDFDEETRKELKEWANDPTITEDDVKEYLAEEYPWALEPVEVPDEQEEPKAPAKKAPPKKSPPKKEVAKIETKAEEKKEEVVSTTNSQVSEADIADAQAMANALDEFDM